MILHDIFAEFFQCGKVIIPSFLFSCGESLGTRQECCMRDKATASRRHLLLICCICTFKLRQNKQQSCIKQIFFNRSQLLVIARNDKRGENPRIPPTLCYPAKVSSSCYANGFILQVVVASCLHSNHKHKRISLAVNCLVNRSKEPLHI